MRIRTPKLSDAKDYTELINAIVREGEFTARGKLVTQTEEKAWLSTALNEISAKKLLILCMELDGEIVGHATVVKGTGANIHIGTLGLLVRPDLRKRGIGSSLVKEALQKSKKFLNVDLINLQVRKGNDGAYVFYKKLGFEKYGELKNGLKIKNNYHDTIYMYKELS